MPAHGQREVCGSNLGSANLILKMSWTLKSNCLMGIGKNPALSNRRKSKGYREKTDLKWLGIKSKRKVNHSTVNVIMCVIRLNK